MIIQKGKRNTAVIFADKIDQQTKTQIASILREGAYADCKIRFMPDVHAGRHVPVGTVMSVNKQLSPSMLGSDIGCGIEVTRISACDIDFQKLDAFVHAQIPCGAKIHDEPKTRYDLSGLHCMAAVDVSRAMRSLGTLGGGNHFIEIDRCKDGTLLLVVHSGSRQLGSDVLHYYQKAAFRARCKKERRKCFSEQDSADHRGFVKAQYFSDRHVGQTEALMERELLTQYIDDVKIVNSYAACNRAAISDLICSAMGFEVLERFSCVHNYIDTEHMILRKGAISARQGERVVIPLNMRDGVILGVGIGNPDWNFSAPHGAGRACNRQDAKYAYTVEQFQREMEGIFTTTTAEGSLDECPMAYKHPERILPFLTETVEITEIAKPIYNFKAC